MTREFKIKWYTAWKVIPYFYPGIWAILCGMYYLSTFIPVYPWLYFFVIVAIYYFGYRPMNAMLDMWSFERYTVFIFNEEENYIIYKPVRSFSVEYKFHISEIEKIKKYRNGKMLFVKQYYYIVFLRDGSEICLSSLLVGDLKKMIPMVMCEYVKDKFAYPLC